MTQPWPDAENLPDDEPELLRDHDDVAWLLAAHQPEGGLDEGDHGYDDPGGGVRKPPGPGDGRPPLVRHIEEPDES